MSSLPKYPTTLTRQQISRWLEERETALLLADGLEEAFLGVDDSDTDHPRAVYSVDRCIEILSRDMSPEDAVEYFDYNVACAYVGEQTPLFIETPFLPPLAALTRPAPGV